MTKREMTEAEIAIAADIISKGALIAGIVCIIGIILIISAHRILKRGKAERVELDKKYGFDTRGVLELKMENDRLERNGMRGFLLGMLGWIFAIFGGLSAGVFVFIKIVMGF